jgi:heat-inducible transcriptional repressor
MITDLNDRAREVFRFIVDSYLETGQPVGSRTISKHTAINVSPASIRNTMADLEEIGLLHSPHISAGRLPTELGLRLYIDGLMEIGRLSSDERERIETTCAAQGRPMDDVLHQTTSLLSGLSSCASLVIAPKQDQSIKQVQFVPIEPGKVLSVLVFENGMVENRMMDVPLNLQAASVTAATNYLNAKLAGHKINAAKSLIENEMKANQTQLDTLTQQLVKDGLALPTSGTNISDRIIVRGQSQLLQNVEAIEDLERARLLLGYLEEQKNMIGLLDAMHDAQGVQIFIGTENKIFDQSGWSMVISPYKDTEENIIGAIGVIGPTRLNYDRIIPIVDYTSQTMERLLEKM